jgi:sn-glycerol 3-phosphate transport system substrate-binding protein
MGGTIGPVENRYKRHFYHNRRFDEMAAGAPGETRGRAVAGRCAYNAPLDRVFEEYVMSFVKCAAVVGLAVLSISAPAAPKAASAPAAGPAVLQLSHQLGEVQAERLEAFVDNFNRQAKGARIDVVRRANGDAPSQLNLVTREEHARFLARKANFKPIYQLTRVDAAKFAPELRGNPIYAKGQLLALPVAFSTPVLYINRKAFRDAGLNPDAPPLTWAETQNAAGRLLAAGSRCPYTTSWPVWILIDNISAWNGAGVSDARGKLSFNGLLQIKHIAMMAAWRNSKYFTYFGRRDEADQRFANGECGMLTSASSLYATLPERVKQNVGVSALPYHDDVAGAPKNTLAEGASLWVASGLKPAEAKAAAQFVEYVLGPEVQIELTLSGGYLPMTGVARAAAGSRLKRTDLDGLRVATAQLKGKDSSPAVRVSQIEPVRRIAEEELEAVWSGRKPAKEALDEAVRRGNAAMGKR